MGEVTASLGRTLTPATICCLLLVERENEDQKGKLQKRRAESGDVSGKGRVFDSLFGRTNTADCSYQSNLSWIS